MKIIFSAFLAAWLTMALIFAADGQSSVPFTGKVCSQAGQPLGGATVRIYRTGSADILKVVTTDDAGLFSTGQLESGPYKLSVTMTGYQLYIVSFQTNSSRQLPLILLKQEPLALKEIRVTSQKPAVEQKIDRTVVNVDAMVSSAGGTALEVLEKSPGVVLDQNGAVTLKGKSVQVFIDDKPAYLSGADLENYLRALPASAISQVELMSNPPANYDAAGNGGIINIRTKKGKLKGLNAGANLSYVQGRYARTNNSLNLNYRHGKLNVFANLAYSTTNNYSDMDFYRHYIASSGELLSNFTQNSYTHRSGQSSGGKIGLDYYFSDKTMIGIGITGLYHPSAQTVPVKSTFTNAQDRPDSTVIADNYQKALFKNAAFNINYRHTYSQLGRALTADLDFITYGTSSNQTFNNNSYSPNGNLTNSYLLSGSLPSAIQIYSAKTDYAQPLKNGVNLSSGLKTSYTRTDNTADYQYSQGQVMLPDYNKTNHFLYRENINSAYLNANKDFKRIALQTGLRMENTFLAGHQLGNIQKPDSIFRRQYTSLFPTFYLQYKLDSAGRHQLGLNYGRRIERPYYQDLNPFLSPLDKFTYYAGNPFLKPAFTNALELSHTFNTRFTTTFSYSRTREQINETIEIVNGTYFSRPGNVGRVAFKSVSLDCSLDLARWLNLHFYGQLSQIHTVSAFYTGPLDTKGTFYYLKPIVQLRPGRDWTLQADGYYQSRVTNVQFIAGVQKRVNFAAAKKLSASTSLKLVLNDAFHSYVNSGIINNLALTKADYRNTGDTRTLVLSLNYRFGKALADQRKHDTNGAESEQNRVKN